MFGPAAVSIGELPDAAAAGSALPPLRGGPGAGRDSFDGLPSFDVPDGGTPQAARDSFDGLPSFI